MRRFIVAVVVTLFALVLAGCSSGSEPRQEPFVGQWESTGGDKISLVVDAPTEGAYPVKVVSGDINVTKSATKVTDTEYTADPGWKFVLVDEDLMTVTIDAKSGPVATSFKRIGG